MKKEGHKVINKKIGSLVELFKNAKFIVLNVMVLVILAFALISGDVKKIVLNFYKNVTGQQFETFSPIEMEELSNETYLILKHKLLQDQNIRIENVDVRIFKESETSYKYRVILSEDVFFYKIKKNSNGIWQINTIQEK
jgi:hypothetical protein